VARRTVCAVICCYQCFISVLLTLRGTYKLSMFSLSGQGVQIELAWSIWSHRARLRQCGPATAASCQVETRQFPPATRSSSLQIANLQLLVESKFVRNCKRYSPPDAKVCMGLTSSGQLGGIANLQLFEQIAKVQPATSRDH